MTPNEEQKEKKKRKRRMKKMNLADLLSKVKTDAINESYMEQERDRNASMSTSPMKTMDSLNTTADKSHPSPLKLIPLSADERYLIIQQALLFKRK